MKGVVFTELVNMIEDQFGLEVLDEVIENANLESGGAYTAVGDYPDSEIYSILAELGKITGLNTKQMLAAYSGCFFSMLNLTYTNFFKKHDCALKFLASLDDYIHPEALKLYPGAKVPGFKPNWINDNELELVYTSERKMGDLARGLIDQTISHYKEEVVVSETYLEKDGSKIKYTLVKS